MDQAPNTKGFAAHGSNFGRQGTITQSTNTRTITLLTNDEARPIAVNIAKLALGARNG